MDRIELSASQHFEIEKINRAIDSETDVQKLKTVMKTLVKAWMMQRCTTMWMMRQNAKTAPLVTSLDR